MCTFFWAINPNAVVAYIPNIILVTVSYYVFLNLFEINERNIYWITLGLFFCALLSVIFVWPSYFGKDWFSFLLNKDPTKSGSSKTSIRAGGILARSDMALLLAALIPYLYNFGIFYLRSLRKYVHFIGIFLFLTLVLTLNRMHFFATSLSIAFLLWYAIKQKVVKAQIGFIIVGGALFLIMIGYVISLNGNSYEETLERSTWKGRFEQYNAAFQNIKYSQGLGIGMNNFLISGISASLLADINGAFESGNTVHNDYLRVLTEYGIIGLLFYILFFISVTRQRAKASYMQPLVRGAKANIITLAIIGISAPALNKDSALIIIGIYLAIIKFYKDKEAPRGLIEITKKYS
jgi:hypothetical protein